MSLKLELEKRVEQLEGRKMSINAYLKHPGSFIGKAQYTEADVQKVENEIEETWAAISGIKEWLKDKRNMDLLEIN